MLAAMHNMELYTFASVNKLKINYYVTKHH